MGDCSVAAEEREEVGVEEEKEKEKVFVAVGSDVAAGKSMLEWAMRRLEGRRICLVHVHRPKRSGSVDWKFLAVKLKQLAVTEQREGEVQKLLNEYTSFLSDKGVDADTWWIEMENIARGIVKLIVQYNIKYLVMGAASKLYDSRGLTEVTSKTALSVCEEAPSSCLIWFVSEGRLVHTRGNSDYQDEVELTNASPFTTSDIGVSNSDGLRPTQIMNRQRSSSFLQSEKDSTINFGIEPWRTWKRVRSRRALSLNLPKNEASDLFNSSGLLPEEQKIEPQSTDEPQAFGESLIRFKSEEDTSDALNKAEEFERLCATEINRKCQLEKILAETIEEVEKMKNQNIELMKKIQLVRENFPVLESQRAESIDSVEELQEKMSTAVELLISFKAKRDHMREEYGNLVRELHKFQNKVNGHALSLNGVPSLTATLSEISDATHNFNPARKIGEGRNGSVYQGFLSHMIVSIKMLPDYGSKDRPRFLQEVEEISQVRHPHLVALIGSCPDSRALIYEYLENGSLEDRLARRQGKTPPLSCQTRIRIATEICSVLIFLHSNKPRILHGNLKPSNVLLGAGLVSKVSELGVSRLLNSTNSNLVSEYADPESLETGQLTPESDIYSFGVILLRLLTGMQGSDVRRNVTCALEKGHIELVVDASAGNWPAEVTEQLLYIALRCCAIKSSDRPDLASEVLSALAQMRNSCMSSTTCRIPKEDNRPPSQFVCPIYQDVFEDPKIAADGYTYEGEAIEGWLNSGHNTSPMTNLKLDHTSLIPNYALSYAIQEWQQKF